jgi:hypothetical protein
VKKQRLSDVFGVSRDFPLTYAERKNVDTKFQNNLARDKHIVVYGGSKQGKTCLRKHSLQSKDYIVVQCGNTTDAYQLYSIILKEAGATTMVTEQKTTRGTFKWHFQAGRRILSKSESWGLFRYGEKSNDL